MKGKDYLSLIMSLSYVAYKTRLDVSFHTSWLGQFSNDPTVECYEAGLCILSYLFKTKDLSITYGGAIREPNLKTCKPPNPPWGSIIKVSL